MTKASNRIKDMESEQKTSRYINAGTVLLEEQTDMD